ncbi:hypothetical protein [Streptomyces sp. NRRL F-5135]|uniref:hypothetical protein n=1 Tax=Streptomyces sp. NRRL F-5135 TaxID=1463858 RepID=UPI00131D6414|nr:hypothetical protein [Streptomyces sp. NRRL F-5135]
MTWQAEHYNAVLTEILLSRKVGVAHVRHIGDLISVRAQLSMGMQGAVGLSFDRRADIAEAVLGFEEACQQAWRAVAGEPNIDRRVSKLTCLEQALESAVAGIRGIAHRNGIRCDAARLDG